MSNQINATFSSGLIDSFREHINEIDAPVYSEKELKATGDRLLIRFIDELPVEN